MRSLAHYLVIVSLALCCTNSSAQEVEDKTLNVKPAAEPIPALKYRAWLPDHKLKAGNAEFHFMRALVIWNGFPSELRSKIEGWTDLTQPRDAEEVRQALQSIDAVFSELHALAMSEDQRFNHRLREFRGPEIYKYMLPEIQQARLLARLLDVRITQEMADGQIELALASIQDGFRLSAFIGGGETLIHQLVGIAVEAIMLAKVEQLIQQKNAPNLYWALATLPRPLIDVRKSVMLELSAIKRVVPLLEEAASDDRPDDYWETEWNKQIDQLKALGIDSQDDLKALKELSVSAQAPARGRLIKSGMDEVKVSAMPNMRAVLLDASREIEIVGDDLVKNCLLPANFRGENTATRLSDYVAKNRHTSGAAIIIGFLFPAVDAVRNAGERQTYFVNRLMTIEALRMHAATHDGQLPKSLGELSPVPALPNPYTGGNFEYKLESVDQRMVVTLQADCPEATRYFATIKVAFPAPKDKSTE